MEDEKQLCLSATNTRKLLIQEKKIQKTKTVKLPAPQDDNLLPSTKCKTKLTCEVI